MPQWLLTLLYENLTHIIVSVAGLLLGGLQMLIFRWQRLIREDWVRAQAERNASFQAHKLVNEHGALLVEAAEQIDLQTSHTLPELSQTMCSIAQQQGKLQQSLDFLLERGPKEINTQLALLQREVAQLEAQLKILASSSS